MPDTAGPHKLKAGFPCTDIVLAFQPAACTPSLCVVQFVE
jgi:hypothetical protein